MDLRVAEKPEWPGLLAYLLQRLCEVVGQVCIELFVKPGRGKTKTYLRSVKELPIDDVGFRTVDLVAHDWMADCGQVDTYLMGTARLRSDL